VAYQLHEGSCHGDGHLAMDPAEVEQQIAAAKRMKAILRAMGGVLIVLGRLYRLHSCNRAPSRGGLMPVALADDQCRPVAGPFSASCLARRRVRVLLGRRFHATRIRQPPSRRGVAGCIYRDVAQSWLNTCNSLSRG
jgi:hypothetical protein